MDIYFNHQALVNTLLGNLFYAGLSLGGTVALHYFFLVYAKKKGWPVPGNMQFPHVPGLYFF
jgi:hypothetical protein